MNYLTREGELVGGATPGEVVANLRRAARSLGDGCEPGASDASWMEAVAERCWLQCGAEVRSDTAEEFLKDLAAVGLLAAVRLC